MLRCIFVTLNYLLLNYGNAMIYAYLHESKNQNFGYLRYAIITFNKLSSIYRYTIIAKIVLWTC